MMGASNAFATGYMANVAPPPLPDYHSNNALIQPPQPQPPPPPPPPPQQQTNQPQLPIQQQPIGVTSRSIVMFNHLIT